VRASAEGGHGGLTRVRTDDARPSEHPDLDGLHHHLRFVLSPGPTPAASLLVGALDAPVGTRLELGPMAAALAQEISACVAARGGAALVVDYGSDGHAGAVQESLRGIKAHRFVHPLREPGLVDLSVDVNFADLRRAACSIPKPSANATAVVSQASFLKTLGIEYRCVAARLLLRLRLLLPRPCFGCTQQPTNQRANPAWRRCCVTRPPRRTKSSPYSLAM
jgi:hypothetical protein